ncbi:MAG: TRAP transporter substrate-binding protein [Desulfobacterales bacterium]|nr:TRAP transporter substrate-binding protein [Desulfofustis sp.]NNK94630.1 TRAP transporter substrate-binding protein [Desulfobacterales bacterium]
MRMTHIRFGGYQPPASVHNQAAELLGQRLTALLGDAVRFELDGNIVNSGYKAADLLKLTESGELDMCYFSTSYLAERVPEFALFDLPFVIDQRDHAYAVMDGPFGKLLAEKVRASTGYRLLGFWDNGFRHLSNKHRPIRIPADIQGMSIRTLFSDLHAEVFGLLGFNPIALDVKELLSGVQSGEVEAQENPLTNYYKFGIYKHHPYITLTAHFFGVAALLCNNESFENWSNEFKEALAIAAAEATVEQRRLAAADDEEILEKIVAEKVNIVTLKKEERTAFKDEVAPILEEQQKRFGKGLFSYFV